MSEFNLAAGIAHAGLLEQYRHSWYWWHLCLSFYEGGGRVYSTVPKNFSLLSLSPYACVSDLYSYMEARLQNILILGCLVLIYINCKFSMLN